MRRGPGAGEPRDYRVGVESTVRAVQETQGPATSAKKTEWKREHSDLPPPSASVSLRFCVERSISRKEEEDEKEDVWFAGQLVLPHGAGQVVVSQAVLLFSCTL